MSEVSMRNTMRERCRSAWGSKELQWVRLEDSLSPGIPDIYMCYRGINIWIETKQMDGHKLPKRADTAVRIGLQPEQCVWLQEHKDAGGHGFVVFKLDREWMLFDDWFTMLRDGAPLDMLRDKARFRWNNAFEPSYLLEAVEYGEL